MQWFGVEEFALLCEELPRVPIPLGVHCGWCDEPFGPTDNGLYFANADAPPVHHDCFIRQTVGSVGHQLRTCSCFGGRGNGDPPGLTKREAARVAAGIGTRRAWGERPRWNGVRH